MRRLRLAVVCCLAGGAAQVVVGGFAATVPALGMDAAPIAAWSLLLTVVHLTRVVGVLGLAWSGRIGKGRPARIGFAAAVVGLAAFVPAELLYLTVPGWRSVLDGAVFPIGTLLAALGLLVVGVAVLRAGQWSGPGRFTPLLTGGYVFVVLFPAFALGSAGAVAGIGGWGVCWILLGVALAPAPARVTTPPAVAVST